MSGGSPRSQRLWEPAREELFQTAPISAVPESEWAPPEVSFSDRLLHAWTKLIKRLWTHQVESTVLYWEVELSAASTFPCMLIVGLLFGKMLPCRREFAHYLSYRQLWPSSSPGNPLSFQGKEKKNFFLFFLFFPQRNWFTYNLIISSTSYPILVVENNLSPLSRCGLRSLSIFPPFQLSA